MSTTSTDIVKRIWVLQRQADVYRLESVKETANNLLAEFRSIEKRLKEAEQELYKFITTP